MNDLDKSIGGNNRHTFWCESHQQMRFYGTCLNLKDAYENGRIKPDTSHPQGDCATAMCKGNCVAIKMREEEIAAGKSLYFKEAQIRTERIVRETEGNDESYLRGWNQVGRSLGKEEKKMTVSKPVEKTVSQPQKKSEIEIKTVDMAALITKEVRAEQARSPKEQIIAMKRQIVSIAKTDPSRAREMLAKLRKLEEKLA